MTISRKSSPLFRRSLALAILGALIGILLFGVVLPIYGSYTNARASVEQLQAALSRVNVRETDVVDLKAEATRLRSAKIKTIGLLQSANDSLAAADLQNRIKSLVESIHGDLQSTQILSARTEGNFRRVAIRSQIYVDVAGLQRILYGLETASPMLFLDNIDVRIRPDRKPGATDQAPLDVSFDVYGYIGEST